MDDIVTPSARELEYLVRIIERAATVRTRAGWSSWSQGLLQTLLPHQAMVCLHMGERGQLLDAHCLHGEMAHAAQAERLRALAARLAAICRSQYGLPWAVGGAETSAALTELRREISGLVAGELLLHGSGELQGGASMFVLFGMPDEGRARHRYFIELLLPCMHLAWQRQAAHQPPASFPEAGALADPLTGRELEILRGLKEGKINAEIGLALGISAHTVKKHVYNIYRKLNVQNRVQAVSRAAALALTAQAV
ncbi:helix-turn-helix transcriptional regulator [Pseudoduganella aquatica]|uniref:Helix-turn-helix transcriptional regulator n=1 Tax=Pseudoduganella aquatica TaxID=2660641 RepID=A0A7X4H9C8_9BURK|nr:helix-turn-helix transcriptional regulator [Pseudoduganella aquatica]MYN06140.1 helix-turn-helix transcriptional regulator [Pseudoduganella aquatica]